MSQMLAAFLPEIVLVAGIVFLILVRAVLVRHPGALDVTASITAVAVLALFTGLVLREEGAGPLFSGMIVFGSLAVFFRVLFGAVGLATIVLSRRSADLDPGDWAEYLALLLGLVLGAGLFAVAGNLLMLYLAMEFMSVISYILTAFVRRIPRSSEAGLKYAIYGGVASGVFLFGMSLFYGMTGGLSYGAVSAALAGGGVPAIGASAAMMLMLVGFSFKIAAVPFHMWCPDVYEGAPAPFTACLSVLPKAAGFAALVRFTVGVLSVPAQGGWAQVAGLRWPAIIAIISAVTMTLGNLTAIRQSNLKRLLAYSSIAHAGYILMGLAAFSELGTEAILFYLVAYAVMNLGAFLVVIIIANAWGTEDIAAWRGLGRRSAAGSAVAVAMTAFLFSLTGIPPFVGFIGKFYLFSAVLSTKLYWLAIIGAVNSVVSLFYYMRIVKAMFLDAPDAERAPLSVPRLHAAALAALAVVTVLLGVWWQPLTRVTSDAVKELAASVAPATTIGGSVVTLRSAK